MLTALLAGSLYAPSEARAGCDHRPFLGDGPGEVKLPADAALPPNPATDGDTPTTPCKGPGCSRGPSHAPATPPAPAPNELKPGWALVPGPPLDEAGRAGRLYPLPSATPVRHGAGIFHPPRPSSSSASF
ncbi:MAG TPA: hypothetical protein VFE78_23755 [Gemmataceae bacterium]|nr:hypothetical protein [Gemmataceae bacterium]